MQISLHLICQLRGGADKEESEDRGRTGPAQVAARALRCAGKSRLVLAEMRSSDNRPVTAVQGKAEQSTSIRESCP